MKLKKVDIKKIKVPEVRVTASYDEEMQKLLHDSLEAMGQQVPIVVVQSGDDCILVDGLHRLEEARDKGESTIDAVIFEGKPRDALLKNLVLNRVRGKTKASEMVKVIAELANEYKMGIEEIETATGISQGLIEKYLQVATASESVKEALDAEVIGVGHAYEMSRLPNHIVQDKMMAMYQLWRWSVKDLKQYIDQIISMIPEAKGQLASPPTKEPQKYKCQICALEATLGELRPAMLCPKCFGKIWDEAHKAPPLPTIKAMAEGG